MATGTDVEHILEQMAALRSEVDVEVDELIEDARVLSDWRYYVRTYPWPTLGAAALVGYLLVPQRLRLVSPDPATLAKLAEENRVVIRPQPEPEPKGVAAAVATFLLTTLLRSGLAMAGHHLGQMFSQQTVANGKTVTAEEHLR